MNKLTITFTAEDGRENTWEFSPGEYEFSEERGFHRVRGADGSVLDIGWNGQRRLTIKAWKGCASFDTFTSEDTITSGR